MPFASLGEFVDALRAAGELHTVDATVDPRLEISAVTDRVVKAGGPALLFSSVKGSRFPVLTNQFGTHRRMAMAFDASNLEEVGSRIRKLLDVTPRGTSFVGKLRGALRLATHRTEAIACRLDSLRIGGEMSLAVERRKNSASHQGCTAQPREDRPTEPAHRNAATIEIVAKFTIHRQRWIVAEVDRGWLGPM